MTIFVLIDSPVAYCQGTSAKQDAQAILTLTNNLEQLANLLPGSYDNSKQHDALSADFHHVQMQVYRIWSDRDDALWFYVEQALYDLPEDPHYQWVYKVFRGERDTLISEIYRLAQPEKAVGQGDKPSFWKELHPHQLLLREGCSLYLVRRCNGYYIGNTRGTACTNAIGNSVFMQSQITIGLNTLKIWEKGFDAQGKKVWGSNKGAYCFDRHPTP